MEDALAITFFVVVLAGIRILHPEAHSVIEEHGQFPGGRGDGLGFPDAGPKTAIEGAQRRLGLSDADRGESQKGAGPLP